MTKMVGSLYEGKLILESTFGHAASMEVTVESLQCHLQSRG
jgi:hypothetical protein